jgi:carboxyl-terminal processing protease
LLSAVDICRQFVHSGEIVTTRRRNGSVKEIYLAGPQGSDQGSSLPDFPMVVLVNKYSASASEIVAACLQDHGRAVIAGEQTYGKGTVQEIIELHSDQGALKLTTASYWRPSGKNINRGKSDGDRADWGVVPDEGYQVALEGDKLARKLRWRREHDMAPTNGAAKDKRPSDEPEARFQTDVDPQLAKAVEYVEKELVQRTQGTP